MNKHKNGFTLVELIVVIAILAILGTIAFITFQGFSRDARDSTRISDMRVIEKKLGVHKLEGKVLPDPDNNIAITASGTIIAYQGNVDTGILSNIKQAGSISDPLTKSHYSYFVEKEKTEFQLMGIMEKVDSKNTDSQQGMSKTIGARLGIIKEKETNKPLEQLSLPGNSFDVFNETEEYVAYLDDDISFSGTGGRLGSFLILESEDTSVFKYDSNLISYIDFDVGETDLSDSGLSVENFGNLQVIEDDTQNTKEVLKCSGTTPDRFRIGNTAGVLGGKSSFTVYASYKIERGANSSTYPMVLSSYGANNGYNFWCQHNLTDIDNPNLACAVRFDDGTGTITTEVGRFDIKYGEYEKFMVTLKDDFFSVYHDGNLIEKINVTGAVNADRVGTGRGLGICGRATGGYTLNGNIEKVYISDIGIEDESSAKAFFEKLSK